MKNYLYRYGLAVILAGGAFVFRQWFAGQFGSTLTYIFLYPSVLITAVLAGVLPGLLATAIAAFLAATWIFPPIGRPWPLSTADLLGLCIFLTMAAFMCLLTGLYHRAQRKVQAFEKEKAARDSEERFHTLADNMAQLAWMADEKGRRFWYNQRWFDFTGTSLEEMRDEGWQKVHHPDHVQRVVDKISRCFLSGETWEDTFPLRGKDGVFRWFLSRAIPIRDADGRVVRWFGTNTDITDLRNVEEALRQREERLNRAQEIAHLGSWELDLVDDVLTWSDEVYRIFGLQPQEFGATYEAFLDAVHPDDRSAVDEAYSNSLREGRDSYEIEHRVVRKPTGEIRFVHEKCEHFRDKTGSIIRSVGMVLDITERKMAEEALRQSDRMKTEFVTTAAHEFRTPLTSIQGFSELLLTREDISPGQRKEFLHYIHERSVALAKIVADLLDIARIEAGLGLPLDLKLYAVGDIFGQVKPFLEIRAARHRLEITLAGEETQLNVDRGKMGQVLENIISNALKYSPEGSPVRVRGEPDRERYRITVSDRGIGMTPEQVARVFDKFYRADASHTAVEGVGLGMSVVKHIIEAFGGRIDVESEFGKGTTVCVILPVAFPQGEKQLETGER